jgi:TRAP-type C4-dicarboxylate transport system permease small subunit
MKAFLARAEPMIGALENTLAALAGVSILVMMGVTFVDVLMRYAFNAPLRWVFDLVTLYLLPAAFFFGFSFALRRGEHVAVDYFARRIPVSLDRALVGTGLIAAAALFSVIAWLGAAEAWSAWVKQEATMGEIAWPAWPSKSVIPIGMLPLVLRSIHLGLANLLVPQALPPGDQADAVGMPQQPFPKA